MSGFSRTVDRRTVDIDSGFEQALTIVYRILFLPLRRSARARCRCGIRSTARATASSALRDAAERTARAPGLWDALRAIARLAHAGCRAGDLLVTPFNGRLFAPARTPLAERRDLDDEAARRAVMALSTRPAPTAPAGNASRIATSASSSSARSTKRCSTTSRASTARA